MAVFSAVTLIEEVGKVPMLALRDVEGGLDSKAFRHHGKKYESAVGNTLYINSRVSRIYGEREERFARWYRDGELMRIRNAALYMDVDADNVIVTPEQVTSRETAFILVCFAGEVLAEIQGYMTGTGPEDWRRILAEVDEFRERFDDPS